jgi:hypothetical protein
MRPPIPLAWLLVLLAGSARADFDPLGYPLDDVLRVNDVWSKGTHNSYHLRPLLYQTVPKEFDYEHAPLPVQLDDQGVRKFELDVFWDPSGFQVHHWNRFDKETTCTTLVLCLSILRDWSLAHPGHQPIFVFVEPKGVHSEITISDEPITGHYDQLDQEIRSVLPPELLVTPDEVRGGAATLAAAIASTGWPTLRATRGRFLLVMLDGGIDRDGYAEGRPSLEGRAMFVGSDPGRADAAVMLRDDPVGEAAEIGQLVGLGYLIRTRSDSLSDAQAGDTTRRDAALASGAQIVSTDYPVPDMLDNDYFVAIPGGTPSACNPITSAGTGCLPSDIENPLFLAPEPGSGPLGALAAAATGALAALRRRRVRV